MKHPMRLSAWRQLLAAFGAAQSNSYVEVRDDLVVLSFGFFDDRVPREQVHWAGESQWPRYGGIGWRLGLSGGLGLIGARSGIVEIKLANPRRTRVLVAPYTYNRVYVSVRDPVALVSDLNDVVPLRATQRRAADIDSWR